MTRRLLCWIIRPLVRWLAHDKPASCCVFRSDEHGACLVITDHVFRLQYLMPFSLNEASKFGKQLIRAAYDHEEGVPTTQPENL